MDMLESFAARAAAVLVKNAPFQPADLVARLAALPTAQRLFASFVFGWWAIMSTIGLIGTVGVLVKYRRPLPPPRLNKDDPRLPGVTVLRPLKGVDANLRGNLLSVLNQDYPADKLELIMSVADVSDPALPIAQSLAAEFPKVAKVHVGELATGKNPKVRNLARSYHAASHDLVWTMDSNVCLDNGGVLLRAVEAVVLQGSGLVHHLPVGVLPAEPAAAGALLEAAFLGTAHAKMYTFFNGVGFASCVIGKSHMYRKSVLDGFTNGKGIEEFKDNLAEDNSVAKIFWNNGHRHAMTPDVCLQSLSPAMRFRDYWNRRIRWIRIRKGTEPAATLLEPLTESVFLGFLLWIASSMVGIDSSRVLLWHFGYWFLSDLVISLRLGYARLPFSLPTLLTAYLGRELLALPLWCAGVAGSSIDWRGRRFVVLPGGGAVPLDRTLSVKEDSGVGLDEEGKEKSSGALLVENGDAHVENGNGTIKGRLRKRN